MAIGGRTSRPTARTLIFDIETSPIIGAVWQPYEANLVWKIQDIYILCFAYKWLGDKKTHVVAQPDFKGYKAGSTDDYQVIKKLHELFNEADVVMAHNGNKFDIKKANSRFIFHKLPPNTPYQKIDTLLMARKYFGFTSNKLDELGEYLGVGRKAPSGLDLWRGCMAGDKKAWAKMCRYNKQDVVLLEKVYLKLRPYDTSHPNMANIEGRPTACPRCGTDKPPHSYGIRHTKSSSYQMWRCPECGGYYQGRKQEPRPKPEYV